MKPKKTIVVGRMDNSKDHTFVSANIVHFRGGVALQFRPARVVTFNPKQLKITIT